MGGGLEKRASQEDEGGRRETEARTRREEQGKDGEKERKVPSIRGGHELGLRGGQSLHKEARSGPEQGKEQREERKEQARKEGEAERNEEETMR